MNIRFSIIEPKHSPALRMTIHLYFFHLSSMNCVRNSNPTISDMYSIPESRSALLRDGIAYLPVVSYPPSYWVSFFVFFSSTLLIDGTIPYRWLFPDNIVPTILSGVKGLTSRSLSLSRSLFSTNIQPLAFAKYMDLPSSPPFTSWPGMHWNTHVLWRTR